MIEKVYLEWEPVITPKEIFQDVIGFSEMKVEKKEFLL